MANIVMLLGKSGTGKTTSIGGLNPQETVICNVLNKRLPIKGANKLYSNENKRLIPTPTYNDVLKTLNLVDCSPNIHNVVLDDMIYLMRKEFFGRAKESGYNKFTEIAQHFQSLIQKLESMKPDLNVFIILHSEDVKSDSIIKEYKVSTVGNLVDNAYNPLEVVATILYSDVKFDDKGKAEYGFYTHRQIINGVVIPAKTPAGMFEQDFIPNDLGIVVNAMSEYFN